MSTNFQKTPLVQSLGKVARAAANKSSWSAGKSYPCIVEEVHGPGIVTVNFQLTTKPFTFHNIMMPVAKPPYMQYPIKKGDKGFATAADASLGQMSGLGSDTPDPSVPVGNLSALSFVWLGHVDEEFIDADALVLYGNILCTPTELAFFGGTKITKQSLPAAATDEATTMILVNTMREMLIAYGLAE